MARQPERLHDPRADQRRPIADDEHAVDGTSAGSVENRRDGRVLVVKPNRNRLVLPRIVELVAPIGREDKIHAKPHGRVTKRPRLVTRRRRKH